MCQINKIISGGQDGVDRGALEAAASAGLETGGWCPPGRVAEDGVIPDSFLLKETPYERSKGAPGIPRSLRTEWNVRDADATLILIPDSDPAKDPGTEWTGTCAGRMNKPLLICDPFISNSYSEILNWLKQVKPQIVNIAGPGEKMFPGIKNATFQILRDLFGKIKFD